MATKNNQQAETQIQLTEPTAAIERVESQSVTPMELLQIAMRDGADLAKLEKLLDLQERWETREAEKAFNAAMNTFKSEAPAIIRNRTVSFNSTSYHYASLDAACEAIIPALSKHGFSHRWDVQQPGDKIVVTCVITHERGHKEKTTIQGPADKSGSKNDIQAIGSGVYYLQRYSLFAALGLAPKGIDNDAQNAPKMDKLNEYLEAIGAAPNMTALQGLFTEAYAKAKDAKDQAAMKTLIAAKDAKKKILGAA